MSADDLDPQIRSFAVEMEKAYAQFPDFARIPLTEVRRIAEQVRAPWRRGGPAMAETREICLPTPHGDVRVRIYRPSTEPSPGALIYLHGGGWTIFSIDTHDRIMREYASRAKLAVIGVDYALSPEAKYPIALEQVLAITRLVARQPAQFGINPGPLAIGGDSAGANLALAAALTLHRTGEELLRGLLLLYGAFDQQISDGAAARYGGRGYMLTPEEMARFWANYLPQDYSPDDVLAQPLQAPLAGLPSAYVLAGACDILAEQSVRLAQKLRLAGVPSELKIYAGATHSFLEAISVSSLADQALADSARWLRTQLVSDTTLRPLA